ncbi:VOC family protein [Rhodohalobacter sp. 8-1]|uniref:VOC family protein n=1 Tax=Rhodohalobacter sp. 8-1 TaxID=3131972 RepID=UPI0030EBD42A
MPDLRFNHYTIKVKNLDISAAFYVDVVGLDEIKNRTEKPYIRWFSIGEGELHIVEGDTSRIQTTVGLHLALKTSDLDGMISQLNSKNILLHDSSGTPHSYTSRADGVRQFYFQDPDGYWIEVNEADSVEG